MSVEEPIFKASYLGSKVLVYSDRIVQKMFLTKKIIPVDQIASIDPVMSGYAGIKIETTGGKKFTIPVGLIAKKKLEDAIFQARRSNKTVVVQSGGSEIGDLEKLAELKAKGLVTEEEFNQKKKQLLGL